jgi:hypothetical protein
LLLDCNGAIMSINPWSTSDYWSSQSPQVVHSLRLQPAVFGLHLLDPYASYIFFHFKEHFSLLTDLSVFLTIMKLNLFRYLPPFLFIVVKKHTYLHSVLYCLYLRGYFSLHFSAPMNNVLFYFRFACCCGNVHRLLGRICCV